MVTRPTTVRSAQGLALGGVSFAARFDRGILGFMGTPLTVPPPGFDDLSVEEQVDYVHALWERVAASANRLPLPEWQRELLEERLEDMERNPDDSVPWEEVREELQAKLTGSR